MSNKIEIVVNKTCAKYNIGLKTIKGSSRKAYIKDVRQILMYALSYYTLFDDVEIGKYFNNRDRTTVIHAKKEVKNALHTNRNLFKKRIKVRDVLKEVRTYINDIKKENKDYVFYNLLNKQQQNMTTEEYYDTITNYEKAM